MTTIDIKLPPKLIPIFIGKSRYRGAYGGRGSAKTRTFAKMTAVQALRYAEMNIRGVIVCGREYMSSLSESSMEEVKAAIQEDPQLEPHFEIGEKYIRTKCGRVKYVFAGLRHNLDSIKSKSRILILWVDEAENVSETAWEKIIPSVRGIEESEVWVTWNPEREGSPTDKRFRQDPPKSSKIVEMNYTDNPWFPKVLDDDRLEDLEKRPETYDHIWEGGYKTHYVGAYWAKHMIMAKDEGRIGFYPQDPLMSVRCWWDIGGTGAKSDAVSIWVGQFINKEKRMINHYTAQGQDMATHVAWLKKHKYEDAYCVLPHDGDTNDKVHDVSYESALQKAGFQVKIIPNQGKGAASKRIEEVRLQFHSITFNEATTIDGRKSLNAYHENINEDLDIGLGPLHDWSSHDADAFGLMCIDYAGVPPKSKPLTVNTRFVV
jgi:phage terminase large subunit